MNSWITATTVEEENAWYAGVLYESSEERSTGLGIIPDGRPSQAERNRAGQEREQQRRDAEAERERQRIEFTKREPKDTLSYAEVYGGQGMTLAAALATLESFGGSVTGRDDGTLHFQLPRRLAPNAISDHAHRAQALEAVRVLDQSRSLVAHSSAVGDPCPTGSRAQEAASFPNEPAPTHRPRDRDPMP